MIQINQTTSTLEAISVLRKMADMLESKSAFLSSGEVNDRRNYCEGRTISIDISVFTDSDEEICI